ncbi:MAG TPA: hypothetical protein VGI45_24835 [Terracidiphilus sp.]|jgi:hypothetical protein
MASWWPGHDLGKWAIVLAVVLFLLQKPWDWFQALATSRLKDWWAARSIASLSKRIAHQERALKEFESLPLVSETEAYILRGISVIGLLCVFIFQMVFVAIPLIVIGIKPHIQGKVSTGEVIFIYCCAIAGFLMGLLFEKKVFNKIDEYRRPRSPYVRQDLEESIKALKLELATKLNITPTSST